MTVAVVIPARFASTRLPGKPLLRDTGKYLIQHVYERAAAAAGTVVVATDDARIAAAVAEFGGRVAMTRADHPSGTDRVAEVAATLDADVVVNLQGDEPHLDPAAVGLLVSLLGRDAGADVATLAAPIRDAAAFHSPNAVKVVCDDRGRALYFSRSPVPHCRDGDPDFAADPPAALLHVGVYAFRRPALLRLAALPPHRLELTEKLEQLRWLAAGTGIAVGVGPAARRGIDTPEDYAAFVADHRR
jgi:3-deoxy-manno-octulosonate cytidylyltransferase (CMP-KDO synthetase)